MTYMYAFTIQRRGAKRHRATNVNRKPSGIDAAMTTKKRIRTGPSPCKIAFVMVTISLQVIEYTRSHIYFCPTLIQAEARLC